jgi:cation transport regulator ChaC
MVELTPRDERTLDRCEGVAAGIYRKEMLRVQPDDGREAMALVYVDNETQIGIPKEGYLERILEGARFHGLSGGAIQGLEAWAG